MEKLRDVKLHKYDVEYVGLLHNLLLIAHNIFKITLYSCKSQILTTSTTHRQYQLTIERLYIH